MNIKKSILFIPLLSILILAGCKEEEDDTSLKGRPTVTSTDPGNSSMDIAVNKSILVTFSEKMDSSTINNTTFTLMQGTTSVAGEISYTDSMATFNPTDLLALNKLYKGTITTAAKNKAGKGLASNHIFSFTTSLPESTLPMVNSTNPAANAVGIARNIEIKAVFSEEMDDQTINTSTFTLMQGSTNIAGSVAYSGTTAMFVPDNALSADLSYTAAITTGVKDLSGNALGSKFVWNFKTGGSVSTLAAVALGAAGNYVILAKTAINVNPTSAITGDVGLSPAAASYITGLSVTKATGYATSSQVTGKIYAADMADPTPINLTTAVNNMITAYNDAAGRPSPDFSELGTGNIGGKTLSPGLYKWTSAVTLPSSITINGGPDDIWIFQISGNLSLSSSVNMTLTGGAQAKNIFWQVAGAVTMGTSAHFEGVILSMTGITMGSKATLKGRALAQTAVILDSNTVTQP